MSEKQNIVLIGLMGSGKTSVAKCLEDKLSSMTYVDTDIEIEKLENKTISQIFAEKGEDYFRHLESWVAEKFAQIPKLIIATGGGIAQNEQNLENLRKKGVIFYLSADIETLCKRLESDNTRPLLENCNTAERLSEILERREGNYKKADHIIEIANKTPEQIAEEIIKIYES